MFLPSPFSFPRARSMADTWCMVGPGICQALFFAQVLSAFICKQAKRPTELGEGGEGGGGVRERRGGGKWGEGEERRYRIIEYPKLAGTNKEH